MSVKIVFNHVRNMFSDKEEKKTPTPPKKKSCTSPNCTCSQPSSAFINLDLKSMIGSQGMKNTADDVSTGIDSIIDSYEPDKAELPEDLTTSCGSGCGCNNGSHQTQNNQKTGVHQLFDKKVDRRQALGMLAGTVGAAVMTTGCSSIVDPKIKEKAKLTWEEYFKGNFRLMTDTEKNNTVKRLERLTQLNHRFHPEIKSTQARKNVLYGYAFNISKCRGYMDCVKGCVKENNLDPETGMQYIRIFEMKKGKMSLEGADGNYHHEVPVEGNFYMGTQCFQCENPPCVPVCPVSATWKEPDGIVVVDYDWCIGCRYCEAACPYWARRFNWKAPKVNKEKVNKQQHYLGNRVRDKGVVEKCTFCIQRTREGKNPACVEACPTGARIFGNLLDPKSEIRWVLANKKVFRLKEELGTEPKFWYFMD